MSERLRFLLVEDDRSDAILLEAELRRAGLDYEAVRVQDEPSFREALREEIDLILCDHSLPAFSSLRALEILTELERDIPFVIVSGSIGEETAVTAMQRGASDYLLKDRLNRLGEAVRNALEQKRLRREEEAARRDLRRSYDALRESEATRGRLMSRLSRAEEDERARIAGDIHDDSIQVMAAVALRLQLLGRSIEDESLREQVAELEAATGTAIRRLRRLLFELRPVTLDRDGLGATLRILVDEMFADGDRSAEVHDRLTQEPEVDLRTTLYRLAHEALVNANKHAKASRIEVTLSERDDGVELVVADDGVGFDPDLVSDAIPGHLGLGSMEERVFLAGGSIEIDSVPGAGTRVTFFVPATRRSPG